MNSTTTRAVVAILATICLIVSTFGLHVEGRSIACPGTTNGSQVCNSQSDNSDSSESQNEIETRFQVPELYKSLIVTGTRVALSQQSFSNHINVDAAMDVLIQFSNELLKPSMALKAASLAVSAFIALLSTFVMFPNSYELITEAWRDPSIVMRTENYKFLTNGLGENSVVELVYMKTDAFLNKVGLKEDSCRQKSICYASAIINKLLPSAASHARSVMDNVAYVGGSKIKNQIKQMQDYLEQNCTQANLPAGREPPLCLANFLGPFISLGPSEKLSKVVRQKSIKTMPTTQTLKPAGAL